MLLLGLVSFLTLLFFLLHKLLQEIILFFPNIDLPLRYIAHSLGLLCLPCVERGHVVHLDQRVVSRSDISHVCAETLSHYKFHNLHSHQSGTDSVGSFLFFLVEAALTQSIFETSLSGITSRVTFEDL